MPVLPERGEKTNNDNYLLPGGSDGPTWRRWHPK